MPVLQGRGNKSFSLALLLFANFANAAAIKHWEPSGTTFKHAEISAAGGIDRYNRRDANLIISPFETDIDKVSKSSTQGSWKVGLGYSLFEDTLPYLSSLLLNLNVYKTSTTLSGSVWQYGQSQFNNYLFNAPIKSTRLMLDLKPSLFNWQSMEPYVILGVGVVWNSLSYGETITDADVNRDSMLLLSKHNLSHLAWDLGVGYKVALTDKLNVSLEYIYATLGHSSPGHDSGSVRLATTPQFSLQSQSLLLGLSLKL